MVSSNSASDSTNFTVSSGEAYELQMGRWSQKLAPLFLDFVGVCDGETMLDVGCGTGSLTFSYAQRTSKSEIVGIDIAEPLVSYAALKNEEGRIEFLKGDACSLPFTEKSFDLALSLLVLMFIPDPNKAISEMRRVARPGATVAAATWDLRGGFPRFVLDTAAVLDPKAQQARSRLLTRPLTTRKELESAWKSVGLQNVEIEEIPIRFDYSSFADYWAPAISGSGPVAEYVGSLDPEKLEQLKKYVELAYLGGEQDGPRSFVAVAMAVKGTVPN